MACHQEVDPHRCIGDLWAPCWVADAPEFDSHLSPCSLRGVHGQQLSFRHCCVHPNPRGPEPSILNGLIAVGRRKRNRFGRARRGELGKGRGGSEEEETRHGKGP